MAVCLMTWLLWSDGERVGQQHHQGQRVRFLLHLSHGHHGGLLPDLRHQGRHWLHPYGEACLPPSMSDVSLCHFLCCMHLSRLISPRVSVTHEQQSLSAFIHRLVGLVVRVSTSRADSQGIDSCLRQDFFRVESYQ